MFEVTIIFCGNLQALYYQFGIKLNNVIDTQVIKLENIGQRDYLFLIIVPYKFSLTFLFFFMFV